MTKKIHHYTIDLHWTGNRGKGTKSYASYGRDHTINAVGKCHEIMGTSDPSFRGDCNRYNPEELFLSSLSSCHMLWYLHLCSANGVIVVDYVDHPKGIMEETSDGSGHFSEVTLHPRVKVQNESMIERATKLHEKANEMCFIANSCNFPVGHNAEVSCGIDAYETDSMDEAAVYLSSSIKNIPNVVFLYGDLGAGKTTLTKEILKQLGSTDEASSPTYNLVNEYHIPNGKFYHIDLYRINNLDEALDMGIEEYLFSEDICFVEWAQLIEPMVDHYWKVEITMDDQNGRIYSIEEVKNTTDN